MKPFYGFVERTKRKGRLTMANYYRTKAGKRINRKLAHILYSMFTENTGTHMCDSGGSAGRHWQRNQKKTLRNFLDMPEIEIDFWRDNEKKVYTPSYCINLFHYLGEALERDSLCETFDKINQKAKNNDSDKMYGLSSEGEEFLDMIGAKIGKPWNSYNGEDPYSQITQGARVEIGEKIYCLLQIHNGADVRGGYTTARLFLLDSEFLYPPMVYATIDGSACVNSDSNNGSMEFDDEERQTKGYGGAEAVFPVGEDKGEPVVTSAGFDVSF
jgi:hypothetical protein